MPDEEKKKFEKEAEQVNLNLSQYVRSRVRAGRLLWDDREFNVSLLNESISVERLSDKVDDSNDKKPEVPDNDIASDILRELPTEGETEGVTEEELRDLIFGSKEDQRAYIEEVCAELHSAGKVTRSWDGGLVKKDDQ